MYRANKADDVALLVRLIAEGVVVPVIDRVFPLEEGPQAMRHYLGAAFAGKIVITM